MPPDPQPKKKLVALQLGLLTDTQDRTLQDRFAEFCEEAAAKLTAVVPANGEPIHEAGKAKAVFSVKVEIERLSDDSLSFIVRDQAASKFPYPPGKGRTSAMVAGLGLHQTVEPAQAPLFNPTEGQPEPLSIPEAEEKTGATL